MALLSRLGGQATETDGTSTGSSAGTTVTCSASANTKGSWVQLVAATSQASGWVIPVINRGNAATRYLVDIGIGSAGNEVVLIPNLPYQSNSSSSPNGSAFPFPLWLPAGVRVAARAQCGLSSSRTVVASLLGVAGPDLDGISGMQVEAAGPTTADSGLVTIDPGGSANTKSAYAELIASTAFRYRWVNLAFCGDAQSRNTAGINWLVDIAIGGSGSEIDVVSNFHVATAETNDLPSPICVPLPLTVPAGSRLSARVQCSVTTASERLLDVGVFGCG